MVNDILRLLTLVYLKSVDTETVRPWSSVVSLMIARRIGPNKRACDCHSVQGHHLRYCGTPIYSPPPRVHCFQSRKCSPEK